MRSVAFAFVAILVATGAWAQDGAHGPTFEALEVVGDPVRADIEVFYECVPLCEVPPDWTVVNGGANPSGPSWDNPYNCGSGLVLCPPDDPDYGFSFYCQPGGEDELQDEWLISPAFDAGSVSTLMLSFAHGVGPWASCTHTNHIHLSTDGVNWTPVWSMPCTAEYEDFTLYYESADVGAFAGEPTLYLAIQYQGQGAEAWWIDDILLSGDELAPVEELSWSTVKGIYR